MTQDSDFWKLARSIETIDQLFKQETAKAVNRNLTARNWLIGFYLFHYEQQGNDRAEYGTRLLQNLAKNLNSRSLSYGNLKLYRQFYQEFRQLEIPIRHYISTNNDIVNYLSSQIGQTLLGHLGEEVKDTSRLHIPEIGQTPLGQLHAETIFRCIPYSHLTLLFPIKDVEKRTFFLTGGQTPCDEMPVYSTSRPSTIANTQVRLFPFRPSLARSTTVSSSSMRTCGIVATRSRTRDVNYSLLIRWESTKQLY